MSWTQTGEEALRALLVLFVPGVLLGAALGLRRWWLVAAAPALGIGVLGAWAVLLAEIGASWGPVTAAAASLVTAGLIAALPSARRPRSSHVAAVTHDPGELGWAPFTLVALVAAAILAAGATMTGMGTPDTPPQTWDAVFHLNAVQRVLDMGDASSLHLGTLNAPLRDVAIYPAGWHAAVSLVVGESIPAAANVLAVGIAALVFPLGSAMLGSALVPSSRYLPGLAALASVTFVAFPARMLSYGTLWPNSLGFALLPVAVALTARLVYPRARTGAAPYRRGPLLAALLAALAGITVAHPNTLVSYAVVVVVLGVIVVVRAAVRAARAAVRRRSWATGAELLVGVCVVVVIAGLALRSPQMQSASAYARPTYAQPGDALVQAITDSQLASIGAGNVEQSWVLAALVVVGLLAATVRRTTRWLAVAFLAVLTLHVAANDPSLPIGVLAGPWYNDAVRLGALVVVVAVPVVALGLHVAIDASSALLTLLRRARDSPAVRLRPYVDRGMLIVSGVVALAVGAAFVVTTEGVRHDLREKRIKAEYGRSQDPLWEGIVTDGEIEMLVGLDAVLPDDSLVLGSPFTGTALAYALGGVDVVYPHLRGSWSPDARYLGLHLQEIATDPEVCAAINRLGVTHVYLDSQVYWPTHPSQSLYTGIPSVLQAPGGFTLVVAAERAKVYSVDMC